MTFHAFAFVVRGSGKFPFHMLSHDTCIPLSEQQFVVAFAMHDGERKVELVAFRPEDSELVLHEEEWSKTGWVVDTRTIHQIPE